MCIFVLEELLHFVIACLFLYPFLFFYTAFYCCLFISLSPYVFTLTLLLCFCLFVNHVKKPISIFVIIYMKTNKLLSFSLCPNCYKKWPYQLVTEPLTYTHYIIVIQVSITQFSPIHLNSHTYIIGHYNPSVRIIDLVSHTTYVMCVNFRHKCRAGPTV